MVWWFDIYCKVITMIVLANTSIMHHNCHFFFMMRTFTIYSPSNFQVYNTVLLTIIAVLHIRLPRTYSSYFKSQLFKSPHITDGIQCLPCMTHLTYHKALKVHPCCHKWQYNLFSHGWMMFHYIYDISYISHIFIYH